MKSTKAILTLYLSIIAILTLFADESSSSPNIEFQYPYGAAIIGTYIDFDGTFLQEMISLYDDQDRLVTLVCSEADGSFAFSGLKLGTYYLKFEKKGSPSVWYGGDAKQGIIVGKSDIRIEFSFIKGNP